MCPDCNHFLCDRDEKIIEDGFTILRCHKCGASALALEWAEALEIYRRALQGQQLSGRRSGNA